MDTPFILCHCQDVSNRTHHRHRSQKERETMDAFGGFFTGFLFDTARDVLKELVKSAIERKLNHIVEEQVRQAIIEYLSSQKPSQEIHIHVEVGTIDVLLQEVYAIANASNVLKVKGSTIEIQHAPLIKIPETIREMRLRQRVFSIKAELNETARQDLTLGGEAAELPSPSQETSEPPLMFPQPVPPERRDVDNIIREYKKRIQSIIDREEYSQ